MPLLENARLKTGGLHLAFTHPLAIGARMNARSIARIRRPIALAAAAAMLPLTAGCSLIGGGAGPSETGYVARDAESLYAAAKDRLDAGDARVAAALFDEVERQHPYSPWARRAQLMSSFSYYIQRDYTKSIETAQRFLSIHPGNKDAPYAYYLIALSYYEQINDVDRDQKITEQALTALNDVQRRYPDSQYAADARCSTAMPAGTWPGSRTPGPSGAPLPRGSRRRARRSRKARPTRTCCSRISPS